MRVSLKLDENDIRTILAHHINELYHTSVLPNDLEIQVKSKQNYHSEWETADIRIEQEIKQ